MVVFKFHLQHSLCNRLYLPSGAKILKIGFQGPAIVAWALLDPNIKTIDEFTIAVVFTGEEFPAGNPRWIGTDQDKQGFVIHAFEM